MVVDAVEQFGWWDWPKPPRSESDVHQLSTVRDAVRRLGLVRRRGRRLHLTARGADLLHDPGRLWAAVATETEDGEDFTRMLTELVGLGLLQGRVEAGELVAVIGPIVAAQGWFTSVGPLTPDELSSAVLYFASDASSFTTGSVLAVDGGAQWSLAGGGDQARESGRSLYDGKKDWT